MANVNRKAKWGVRVYIRNCMLSTEFLLPLGSIVTYWAKLQDERTTGPFSRRNGRWKEIHLLIQALDD